MFQNDNMTMGDAIVEDSGNSTTRRCVTRTKFKHMGLQHLVANEVQLGFVPAT